MDYDDALRWLLTLPDFERTGEYAARSDLAPMLALLAHLGDPHLDRATIHIAGSKGKGSTGAIAETVLRAAGRRTGHYISPHLHRFNERIRIEGAPVPQDAFAVAMSETRAATEAVAPQFPDRKFLAFDALTAAAFVAFRTANVDVQIIEVGLGGTLDSTNVFHHQATQGEPPIVLITPISLEHTAVLGDSIPAIAAQKAGIITEGSTVVVAPQRESALDVFRDVATQRNATIIEVAQACQMSRTSATADGQQFRLKTSRTTYAATLPLAGRHQLENAATAIVACEELVSREGFELTADQVRKGLGTLVWPARLEVLKRGPLVVVDGAHNADSARRMVAALRDDFGLTRATFIFGTLAGKDLGGMADAIAPIAERVMVAGWPSKRAADARLCAEEFRARDVPVTVHGGVADAYESAMAEIGKRGAVVAFGALAFGAAVREYVLGIESDMIRLQAGKPGQ